MKLSGTQLFIVALFSLAILAGFSYLDRTYVPVLFGVVLSVINVFIHINGVATGVPLSPPATALPVATLETTTPAPATASIGMGNPPA